MKRCSAFYGTPPIGVSSLFAACSGSCWLPFSFVLFIFSRRISSIICCCECCSDYNTSMKVLALLVGILGRGCGWAPILLTPSVQLGCCWWGVVGLDFACEGTVLMFHVILDLGGICLRGLLSQSAFQLPSGVTNLNVVGLFCNVGLGCLLLGPSVLSKGVKTNLAWTHFDPACAQTMPRLPRTSFTCPWQAKLLRMSYASRHDNINNRKYFWL